MFRCIIKKKSSRNHATYSDFSFWRKRRNCFVEVKCKISFYCHVIYVVLWNACMNFNSVAEPSRKLKLNQFYSIMFLKINIYKQKTFDVLWKYWIKCFKEGNYIINYYTKTAWFYVSYFWNININFIIHEIF